MTALDPEVLDQLRKIASPTVTSAIQTLNVPCSTLDYSEIGCRFPRLGAMVGYAVTAIVRAEPLHGQRPPEDPWWNHLIQSPVPRVVVLQSIDGPSGHCALWGGVQSNIHHALDCVGLLSNGAVCDLPDAEALGFHLFTFGAAVSHGYMRILAFGLPVKVAGLIVRPGDLLHGDQHGVVVIPHEIAAEIPSIAAGLEAREQRMIAVCQKPGVTLDEIKAARQAMRQN